MTNSKDIGMMAAVVFAVGIVGFNLSDSTLSTNQAELSAMGSGQSIMGHIEVIQQDEQGNILSYLQTDNAIMNEGRNCTAQALFGVSSGCSADPGTFNVISLTNGTIVNNNHLIIPGENTNSSNPGLGRSLATVSETQAASGATTGTSITRISHTFVSTGAGSVTVSGAGLTNSTVANTDAIFAAKGFGSTVTLNQNDQLTVNWDITISGTDTP